MSESVNYIKCVNCQTEFKPKNHRAKYCSDKCKREVKNKQQNERKAKSNQNLVDGCICQICNIKANDLTSHITRMHMPVKEYKQLYPNSPIRSEKYLNEQSIRIKGDKNPAYQHGGKYSALSDKFIHKDKIKKEEVISKISKSNRENGNNNTTLKYWLEQGHSEQDAKKLLSERQSTFSKEKCIEKYGEDKGIKIWQDRQDRWMKTMDEKSIEEKIRISKAKMSPGGCISNAEKEIHSKLTKWFNNIETQFVIKNEDNKKLYTYDIMCNNKIIEYNGDYWHCNPKIYNKDFYNKSRKLLASDIWKRDTDKITKAIDAGYDVLIIWENQYKSNSKDIINKCIEFING